MRNHAVEESKAGSPEEVPGYWREIFPEKLANANGAAFRTQHEIALERFKNLLAYFGSNVPLSRHLANRAYVYLASIAILLT